MPSIGLVSMAGEAACVFTAVKELSLSACQNSWGMWSPGSSWQAKSGLHQFITLCYSNWRRDMLLYIIDRTCTECYMHILEPFNHLCVKLSNT